MTSLGTASRTSVTLAYTPTKTAGQRGSTAVAPTTTVGSLRQSTTLTYAALKTSQPARGSSAGKRQDGANVIVTPSAGVRTVGQLWPRK